MPDEVDTSVQRELDNLRACQAELDRSVSNLAQLHSEDRALWPEWLNMRSEIVRVGESYSKQVMTLSSAGVAVAFGFYEKAVTDLFSATLMTFAMVSWFGALAACLFGQRLAGYAHRFFQGAKFAVDSRCRESSRQEALSRDVLRLTAAILSNDGNAIAEARARAGNVSHQCDEHLRAAKEFDAKAKEYIHTGYDLDDRSVSWLERGFTLFLVGVACSILLVLKQVWTI